MKFVELPREYSNGPTLIGQNLWKANDPGSGCAVLDIKFPRLIKIAGISFKNYYTAELQIWLKYALKMKSEKQNKADQELVWVAAVPKMILMPHPHFEKGGGEYFAVLLPSPHHVAIMRIVFKQPSFQWEHFFIYQLSIVEDLPHIQAQEPFMDEKSKKRLELLKTLEQQTKCINKPKHKNEGNSVKSDKTNNKVEYELTLFPEIY